MSVAGLGSGACALLLRKLSFEPSRICRFLLRVKLTSPTAAFPATAFARLAVRAEVALAGRGPECTAQKAAETAPADSSSSGYGSRGGSRPTLVARAIWPLQS